MSITKFLYLLIISLIPFITKCQTNDTSCNITRIDFLNIDGEFTKANWGGGESLYYNNTHKLFGIIKIGIWVDTFSEFESVYSNDSLIARTEKNEDCRNKILSIYYARDTVYLKLNRVSLIDFLEENTENGIIIEKNEIRINDKKPKFLNEKKVRKFI